MVDIPCNYSDYRSLPKFMTFKEMKKFNSDGQSLII